MNDSGSRRSARTTRRRFLKTVGATVGLAALPRQATSRETTAGGDADDYDAIVIGAGFAGVAAARELGNAGLRTLLLEARGRIGGRTFTAELGGRHFDLGGMWVHWSQPNVWAEISRYGLPLLETPGAMPERLYWWSDGKVHEAGMLDVLPLVREALCAKGPTPDLPMDVLQGFALAAGLMSDFHAEAGAAFPLPFDPFATMDVWSPLDAISVRKRLDDMDLSASRRALLEGLLGAACCGRFSDCGFVEMLRWWALAGLDFQRYNDYAARYKLRDGTVSLLRAMLDDSSAMLLLGTPVRRVEQDADAVRVVTEAGRRLSARAVVAALPMNVIASIEWSPALDPAKVAASRQRHGGAGLKVYARVRGAVPRMAAFAGESEPFSMILTDEAGGEGGTLVAFGTDPDAVDVHDARAVERVVRRFLPDVTVTDTVAYDWTLDPYSLGTWCVLRPGQMSESLAKLREPAGRVYFAGGDFALGFRGFIDGAIESGVRTGQEVADRLVGGERHAARRVDHEPDVQAAAPSFADASAASAPPAGQICTVCHGVAEGAPATVGPSLHGILGRDIAASPGFSYSPSLHARSGSWTTQELEAFLRDPAGYAPGTRMAFSGIKDPAERSAVIEWLAKLR